MPAFRSGHRLSYCTRHVALTKSSAWLFAAPWDLRSFAVVGSDAATGVPFLYETHACFLAVCVCCSHRSVHLCRHAILHPNSGLGYRVLGICVSCHHCLCSVLWFGGCGPHLLASYACQSDGPCVYMSRTVSDSVRAWHHRSRNVCANVIAHLVRMISIPWFCGCITVPRNFYCDTTKTEVNVFCDSLPFISLGSGHTPKSVRALITSSGRWSLCRRRSRVVNVCAVTIVAMWRIKSYITVVPN